jgi:O-antigen ligase
MSKAGAVDVPFRSVMATRAQALALTAVCWGALAFGGAYPWAFWPLACLALASGTLGIAASRELPAAATSRMLIAALSLVAVALAFQLVPLPLSWLRSISPGALDLLEKTDFSYGAGLMRFHPLSVDPAASAAALALFVCFAVLLVGASRAMSAEHPRKFVEALTVFAVVLALVGIIQKPLYGGKLFGFWEPSEVGSPFGPFVNKNHFAGWMLMALPLTLGLMGAGLEQGMRGVRPGWRYRILWLSSPEANRLILYGAAAMIMALSLVLTMSRSGMSAFALSLIMTGVVVARGLKGRSRRTAGATYLLVLAVTIVSWVGADAIAARFSDAKWSEFNNRRGAWADAVSVAKAFPIAGTGLNTYGTAARFYQRHDLKSFYGESHNDYLQLLAEGGLLVSLPIGFCIVALAWEARRRMKQDSASTTWWLRRGAITGLVAIGLQETVEFSLQMPANAVLFAVLCAIAIHRPRSGTAAGKAVQPVAPVRPKLRVVASNAFAGSR